jgi:hypothetical protein
MFWRVLFDRRAICLAIAVAVSVTFQTHHVMVGRSDQLAFSATTDSQNHDLIAAAGNEKTSLELKWAKPRLVPLISSHVECAADRISTFIGRAVSCLPAAFVGLRLVGIVELRL